MAKLSRFFLAVSIVAALIGFSGIGGAMANGLGKALGAVFFVLYFISRTAGQEPSDSPLSQTAAQVEPNDQEFALAAATPVISQRPRRDGHRHGLRAPEEIRQPQHAGHP
jgi:uncharacterized membrane protein YtjA (UPF0391 family)